MISRNLKSLLVLIMLLFQVGLLHAAAAATTTVINLDDLVNQGKLTLNIKVNQKEQQIVGQALTLSIEVSTDRWFATGTRIQHFTLQDVVMQANNITTINGTKRINNQTWATQTHEIVLYPTAYGDYKIPPINVNVSVNTEKNAAVSGILSTEEVMFNIQLPEELNDIDNFIVSPEVTLTIDGQFNQEKDYAIGEAITQTITITATDTPAMMITPINLIMNNESTLEGVSIYHKPPQVFDKSNRGALLGTRIESFTYIFEKSGAYEINEQVIYWWNSESSTLERLLIPSSTWSVSGGESKQENQSFSFKDYHFSIDTIVTFIIIIFLLTLSYIGFKKRHYLSALYNEITHYEQRKLRKDFLNAVAKQNYLVATQYLYQYASLKNRQTFTSGCSQTATLNKLAFKINDNDKTSLTFSLEEANRLISEIDTSSTKIQKHANFIPKERIKLNSE